MTRSIHPKMPPLLGAFDRFGRMVMDLGFNGFLDRLEKAVGPRWTSALAILVSVSIASVAINVTWTNLIKPLASMLSAIPPQPTFWAWVSAAAKPIQTIMTALTIVFLAVEMMLWRRAEWRVSLLQSLLDEERQQVAAQAEETKQLAAEILRLASENQGLRIGKTAD